MRRVVQCVAGLVDGAALLTGCGPEAGTTAGSAAGPSSSTTPGPTAGETATTSPPTTGTVDVQLALDRIAEAQSCEALQMSEEYNGREFGSPEEIAAVQPADLARREALHCEVWTDPTTGSPGLRSVGGAAAPQSEVYLSAVQALKPVAVSTHDTPTIGPFDCVPVPGQNTARCSASYMVDFTLYESIVDAATMNEHLPDLLSSAPATSTPGVLCNGPIYGDAGGGMACFEKVGPDVYVVGYTTYLPSLGADTVAYLTHDVALGQ